MFILTKKPDNIESGAFASCDDEGDTIVQFFVEKDDAVTYNTHLEALGQESAEAADRRRVEEVADVEALGIARFDEAVNLGEVDGAHALLEEVVFGAEARLPQD